MQSQTNQSYQSKLMIVPTLPNQVQVEAFPSLPNQVQVEADC